MFPVFTLIQIASALRTIVLGGALIFGGGWVGGKYLGARWKEYRAKNVQTKPTHKRKSIKESTKVPHNAKDFNKFIKKLTKDKE